MNNSKWNDNLKDSRFMIVGEATDFPVPSANYGSIKLPDGRWIVVEGGEFGDGNYHPHNLYFCRVTLDTNKVTFVKAPDYPSNYYAKGAHGIFGNGKLFCGFGEYWGGSDSAYGSVGVISGNNITWTSSSTPVVAGRNQTMITLKDGRLLKFNGIYWNGSGYIQNQNVSFISVNADNSISAVTIDIPFTVGGAPAVTKVLPDGRIFVVGTKDTVSLQKTCYLGTVNGNTISWVTIGEFPVEMYTGEVFELYDGVYAVYNAAYPPSASELATNPIFLFSIQNNKLLITDIVGIPGIHSAIERFAIMKVSDNLFLLTNGLATPDKSFSTKSYFMKYTKCKIRGNDE